MNQQKNGTAGTSLPKSSGAGRCGRSGKLGCGRPLSRSQACCTHKSTHADKSSWWMRYKKMAIFCFSLVRRRPPGDLVGHLVMLAVRVMSHVISCTPLIITITSHSCFSGSSFPALANDVEGHIATHKQGATWTRVIAKHNAVIPVIPVHLIRSRIPIML